MLAALSFAVCSCFATASSGAQDGAAVAAAERERDEAYACFDRGDFDGALVHFDTAEKRFAALHDELALAKIAHNRAAALVELHRGDEALAGFDRALELGRRLGDDVLVKSSTRNRAIALRNLDRLVEADVAYADAERLHADDGDRPVLAELFADHALVLCNLERPEGSFDLFSNALAAAEEVGDERLLARVHEGQAYAFALRRRFVDALIEGSRAEAHFEKASDAEGRAWLDCTMARVFLLLGRHDEAGERIARAEKTFAKRESNDGLAACAGLRGSLARRRGDGEGAVRALDLAIALSRKTHDGGSEWSWRRERAGALNGLGRSSESLAECDELAALARTPGVHASLDALAWDRTVALVGLGRADVALREIDASRASNALRDDPYAQAHYAIARAIALLGMREHARALAEFARGAELVEALLQGGVARLGQRSSRSLREEFGDALVGALTSLRAIEDPSPADIAAAYHAVETFQGLGMAQGIAEARPSRSWRIPEELRAKHERACSTVAVALERCNQIAGRAAVAPEEDEARTSDLDASRTALAAAERDLVAIVETARALDPKTLGLRHPRAAIEAEVRALLAPDVAFVEYAFAGDVAFAFVLTAEQTSCIDLGPGSLVARDVADVLRLLDPAQREKKPVSSELAIGLRALGRRVVAPVLAALPAEPRITTLLVAPAGDLCRIPLEALLIADPEPGASPKDWPYLIAAHSVAYVHSGTVLREMRLEAKARPRHGRVRFVAFADARSQEKSPARASDALVAIRDSTSLGALPFAASEVIDVARLHIRSDADMQALNAARDRLLATDGDTATFEPIRAAAFALYLRNSAAEADLRACPELADARVLHLACHAIADLASPELSRLVLAGTKDHDGAIYASDLAALDLTGVELLALSACSTNAGRLDAYEGATGLARAGLAAGASAVLSTLWQIDDADARRVVLNLYRNWEMGYRSRIRALAQAKRTAIREGLPISTWSAYVLWDAATDG